MWSKYGLGVEKEFDKVVTMWTHGGGPPGWGWVQYSTLTCLVNMPHLYLSTLIITMWTHGGAPAGWGRVQLGEKKGCGATWKATHRLLIRSTKCTNSSPDCGKVNPQPCEISKDSEEKDMDGSVMVWTDVFSPSFSFSLFNRLCLMW